MISRCVRINSYTLRVSFVVFEYSAVMSDEEKYMTVSRMLRKHLKSRETVNQLPDLALLAPHENNDEPEDCGPLPDPPFEATLITMPPGESSTIKLWLGSVSDAMYPAALRERDVVCIINMAARQCSDIQRIEKISTECLSQWDRVSFNESWYRANLEREDFTYLRVDAEDHPRYKITDDFPACFELLERIERAHNGKDVSVLVHCIQGLNRSAAICVGWLMKRHGMPLEYAIERISAKRPGILTNRSFLRQLIAYERTLHDKPVAQVPSQPRLVSIGNVVERLAEDIS